MIHKSALKGKYVEFIDRNGAFRICKVVIITGNTLTVVDTLKHRERVKRAIKSFVGSITATLRSRLIGPYGENANQRPKIPPMAAINPPKGVTVVILKKPSDVETLQTKLAEVLNE